MNLSRKSLDRLAQRTTWILLVKLMVLAIAIASAASISLTSNMYQAQIGSVFQTANGLLATDKGFSLAAATSSAVGTSCGSPVTFGGSPGAANNAITSGHLVYQVQINSTATAPSNQKFNVTLVLAGTTFGPLCIQTPASPANGQTIDCSFDIASTILPNSPYSFKVMVQ